ncbi:hypothetical protein L3Q82_007804 [Scortum barcoo]|uniref:Uncharacterized protein n=1 Tax=Scortum barcoo TaxID=214431 RepID=A0ACB8WJS9_9TELE|nr:hypothetical protein L3Q82_007804 [Scortum barcoo]
MQDNARSHVAGVCQQFLQDEGIDAMDWPARSPDLNPIEHIWDIMSRSIHQRHVAPQTVQELADALVQWGPEADEAFQQLKRLFTTAPVLTTPDPKLQFIVEVDASNEGVGAVLSQRSTKDNSSMCLSLLHFSFTLTDQPGSRNIKCDALASSVLRKWPKPLRPSCQFAKLHIPSPETSNPWSGKPSSKS